jgi:GT2 family glycosyltransferase
MTVARVGVVVIGRNEGERLRRCLEAVTALKLPFVYVDSGSTDGSVALARGLAGTVVDLDLTIPFTAARARNEGAARLLSTSGAIDYIQFVDGDCELDPDWIGAAAAFLDETPRAAVVCGRRRERHPEASLYNLMCDYEWDGPVGLILECGGDALMRATAFTDVGGYRPDLIAGEEPELCVRLREAGWEIWRLGREMTRHDAQILRFGQWWRRAVRGGHAFAQVSRLHRGSPFGIWAGSVRSAAFWGGALPALALVALLAGAWPLTAIIAAATVLQVFRVARNLAGTHRLARAAFLMVGKVAEFQGACLYWIRAARHGKHVLIEYK